MKGAYYANKDKLYEKFPINRKKRRWDLRILRKRRSVLAWGGKHFAVFLFHSNFLVLHFECVLIFCKKNYEKKKALFLYWFRSFWGYIFFIFSKKQYVGLTFWRKQRNSTADFSIAIWQIKYQFFQQSCVSEWTQKKQSLSKFDYCNVRVR